MSETRYGKLGRFDAELINKIVNLLYLDEISRRNYKNAFLDEFNKYSNVGRKKWEPLNEGCVWELKEVSVIDIRNPREVARWLKEHQHTKYQKQNVERERKSFLENF